MDSSDQSRPCGLCRTENRQVQFDHWQAFNSEAELAQHLDKNLRPRDIDAGVAERALQQWRFHERFRRMERESARDPMLSVEELFQQKFGRRARRGQDL